MGSDRRLGGAALAVDAVCAAVLLVAFVLAGTWIIGALCGVAVRAFDFVRGPS